MTKLEVNHRTINFKNRILQLRTITAVAKLNGIRPLPFRWRTIAIVAFVSIMGLAGTGWQASYDGLGDLSASPVAVDTGSGTVVLSPSANGSSLSGAATLTAVSTKTVGTIATCSTPMRMNTAIITAVLPALRHVHSRAFVPMPSR